MENRGLNDTCAHAQDDVNMCCPHMPEDTFLHGDAYVKFSPNFSCPDSPYFCYMSRGIEFLLILSLRPAKTQISCANVQPDQSSEETVDCQIA